MRYISNLPIKVGSEFRFVVADWDLPTTNKGRARVVVGTIPQLGSTDLRSHGSFAYESATAGIFDTAYSAFTSEGRGPASSPWAGYTRTKEGVRYYHFSAVGKDRMDRASLAALRWVLEQGARGAAAQASRDVDGLIPQGAAGVRSPSDVAQQAQQGSSAASAGSSMSAPGSAPGSAAAPGLVERGVAWVREHPLEAALGVGAAAFAKFRGWI